MWPGTGFEFQGHRPLEREIEDRTHDSRVIPSRATQRVMPDDASVADDAVSPNRSRVQDTLVTGKKQGKSSKIGLEGQNLLPIIAVSSVACVENSLRPRTGNSFVANKESFLRNSELSGAFSELTVKRRRQTSGGPRSGVTFVGIGLCCVEDEQGDRVAVALS
jgi:hypothetical protein